MSWSARPDHRSGNRRGQSEWYDLHPYYGRMVSLLVLPHETGSFAEKRQPNVVMFRVLAPGWTSITRRGVSRLKLCVTPAGIFGYGALSCVMILKHAAHACLNNFEDELQAFIHL